MSYHDEHHLIERQERDFARRCMQHPHGYHGVTASVTPLQVVQLETVACEDCEGMGGDGDDPSVGYRGSECATCHRTGRVARNYLAEAFKIVTGELEVQPERKHVVAVLDYARNLTSAALQMPKEAA